MGLQSSLVKKNTTKLLKTFYGFQKVGDNKTLNAKERIEKALYAAMLSNMLMIEKRLITQQNLGETPVSVRAYE